MTEARSLQRQFHRAQRLEAIGTLASGLPTISTTSSLPFLMAAGLLKSETDSSTGKRMLSIIESSADRGAGNC
jgi:hypothetical protein